MFFPSSGDTAVDDPACGDASASLPPSSFLGERGGVSAAANFIFDTSDCRELRPFCVGDCDDDVGRGAAGCPDDMRTGYSPVLKLLRWDLYESTNRRDELNPDD
jgi:hypothetical protein